MGRASGSADGFRQAAKTLWVAERVRPEVMSESVRVGWRREWSSILARRGREMVVLRGGILVVEGGVVVWEW